MRRTDQQTHINIARIRPEPRHRRSNQKQPVSREDIPDERIQILPQHNLILVHLFSLLRFQIIIPNLAGQFVPIVAFQQIGGESLNFDDSGPGEESFEKGVDEVVLSVLVAYELPFVPVRRVVREVSLAEVA